MSDNAELIARLDEATREYREAVDDAGASVEWKMRDVGFSHGHLHALAADALRKSDNALTECMRPRGDKTPAGEYAALAGDA